MINKQGLRSVKGYQFSGIALGEGKRNFGLIFSSAAKTVGAAVYTKNDFKAAPVIVSRQMDAATPNKRAIIVNSGNANAFTGKQGIIDAKKELCELSQHLHIPESECYVASTGVIGQALSMDAIIGNTALLVSQLGAKEDKNFSTAILTTDTRIKQASVSFQLHGEKITIAACIKGAGMIMPNMATMLCFIVTDAAISQDLLKQALQRSVEDSYNCVTVDSDTSTNDTVFILANAAAGNPEIRTEDSDFEIFYKHLHALNRYMARELIEDAEGRTKTISITVKNAPDREKAKRVAFSVANSPLVKTAFFGEQLNWGRIAMAIGKANIGIQPETLNVSINGHLIVINGEPQLNGKTYDQAEQSLKRDEIEIVIDLQTGEQSIEVLTCDFSIDYIKINADYIS
ncbi:bifunctional glutamate N-acetyltransferase/amino-acid acetyltransferase ArgJ [bacterium]|nr:bifunctional glutamate N-acetyltransferase/amino-acid acetyltransferase ArgJ [bacterium]